MLDRFSRYVWARLYTSKLPVTAVQILNNHALPFFEEHGLKVQTILSDPANPSLTKRVLGAWGVLVYNWARECRSLKRLLPQPQGRQLYERRSPAMAAGLTDRIWSVRELLLSPTYPSGGQR